MVGFALGAVVVGLIVGFVLGLGLSIDDQPTDNESAFVVGEHPAVPHLSVAIRTGDCLGSAVEDVDVTGRQQVVSCRDRHQSEVIGTVSLADFDERPVTGDLDYLANDACAVRLRDYVGSSADDTSLDGSGIIPTRAAWQAGDHRVWCFVDGSTSPRGQGSVKGTHS